MIRRNIRFGAAPIRAASLLGLAAMSWVLVVSASKADPAAPASITVKNFMFSPVPLTVPAGTTVTWTNLDEEPHTAVSDTGLFRSGAMDTYESFSFKFDKPGIYHFACSIHPGMVGTIIVQ
jgi:plastocyanin